MGKGEDNIILMEIRKLTGQLLTSPIGVKDQSVDLIISPILPPPIKKLKESFDAINCILMDVKCCETEFILKQNKSIFFKFQKKTQEQNVTIITFAKN